MACWRLGLQYGSPLQRLLPAKGVGRHQTRQVSRQLRRPRHQCSHQAASRIALARLFVNTEGKSLCCLVWVAGIKTCSTCGAVHTPQPVFEVGQGCHLHSQTNQQSNHLCSSVIHSKLSNLKSGGTFSLCYFQHSSPVVRYAFKS